MTAIRRWYYAHVQKTLGSLLALAAGFDLALLTTYQQDIVQFVGAKWAAYLISAIRVACAVAIVIRARQRQNVLPPPAAGTVRS